MQRGQTDIVEVLPRGRHAASREVVGESQRQRMLAAMAAVAAEKGYARMSVADVIARAGVSRRTFYEHFENKEDCFLAAYDHGVDLLLAAIDTAVTAAAPDWRAAVVAAATSYLELLAARPDFAVTFLIGVPAAGTAAVTRRNVVHERFASQIERVHRAARADVPGLPDTPSYMFRASVGAVNEIVTDHLTRHGPERLTDLRDAIVDIQLSLLGGRDVDWDG